MSEVQIDFRMRAWERVELDSVEHAHIIEAVKSGEIKTTNGIIEADSSISYEVLVESEEYPSPEEEGGHTIEIWEDSKVVWENNTDFDRNTEIEKSIKYLLNDYEITGDIQDAFVKRFLDHLYMIDKGQKVV